MNKIHRFLFKLLMGFEVEELNKLLSFIDLMQEKMEALSNISILSVQATMEQENKQKKFYVLIYDTFEALDKRLNVITESLQIHQQALQKILHPIEEAKDTEDKTKLN